MENNKIAEKAKREKVQIMDTYNDEHWQKKYGVSADQLRATNDIGIPAKIMHLTGMQKEAQA
jgi:hypothetical protein